MTQEFDSFDSFANHLRTVVVPNIPVALELGLKDLGERMVARAKSKFGVYQGRVFTYAKWDPLAQITRMNRLKQGFTENDPLLRSGKTRDSIYATVQNGNLVVGSTEETMMHHELGTEKEPPRPVLGPTAYESKKDIRAAIGIATAIALAPGLKSKLPGFRHIGGSLSSARFDGLAEE